MVSGVSSNIIENFANFNESFHDREDPDDNLTAEDIPACEELLKSVGPLIDLDPTVQQNGDETAPQYGGSTEQQNGDPTSTTYSAPPSETTTTAPFTDVVDVEEEFGDYETPVYEGFTNSDFNASSLVRGRNLHNLLKALLIALVLCSLNHKDVSRMVVEPLVRLTHNKISRTTMVCVLIFLVAYLVIALL
jgi:hypothetical protein